MATYVPGSSQYLPQPTAFTPDYKFLGNVLDVRTDRYNTNYQALNDLYGKVVYADLSRQDTNEVRSQYVKDIAPKIHQIADMDLSLQQNVDAAKGVFAPFFQDDLLVKDMVVTKQYQREMSYADTLLNSLDREQREKYWQTGIDAMKYQMQDFMEADRNTALQMAGPQYVEDVDLYETSLKLLQESGLFDEDIEGLPEFSPDGRWIIKTSGGAMVSKPALQYLRRSLLDDPNVQRAYYTSAYVEQRKYVDNAIQSGAFNDMDQAQRAWANQTITKAEEQLAILTGDQEAEVADQERKLENKEQFTSTYGEAASDLTGGTMAEAIAAYDADKQNLQDKSNQLADASDYKQTSGEVPTNTLLNRAYQLMMGTNIDGDLQAAAITFGETKKKIDIEINQYKLEEIKYQQQINLENLRHRNSMAEASAKQKAEEEAAQPNALAEAAGGGNTAQTRYSDFPTDLGGDAYETNVTNLANAKLSHQDTKIDFLVNTLNDIYATTTGGGKIPVYSTDNLVSVSPLGPNMSLEEAKEYYRNNPEALAIADSKLKTLMTNEKNALVGDNPLIAAKRGWFDAAIDQYENIELRGIEIDNIEQGFYETSQNNLDLTMSMEGEYEGATLKLDKENVPSVFATDESGRTRVLTEEEYIAKFEESLSETVKTWSGGSRDKVRIYKNLPFDRIWHKVDVGGLRDYLYDQAEADADRNMTSGTSYSPGTGGSAQMLQTAGVIGYAGEEEINAEYNKAVRKFALNAYNTQKEAINKGYNEVSVSLAEKIADGSFDETTIAELDNGYKAYNVSAALAGFNPYTGMSEMGVEVYATINAQNPPAPGSTAEALGVEYFNNFNAVPSQAMYIHSGKWDNKNLGSRENILAMDEVYDSKASQLLEQLKTDVIEYAEYGGTAKPDAATPSFELSQSYITDEEGNRYLKYEVSPSRDWLATQKGKGILSADSDQFSNDVNEYTTITVLIDEKNVAFKSSALFTEEPSFVNRQMNINNGTFEFNYPFGGDIKFTSNGDGTNRVSTRRYVYDSDQGKIIADPAGWATQSFDASINPDIIYKQLKNDFSGVASMNLSIMEQNNNLSN